MHSRQLSFFLALCAGLASVPSVHADPITLSYHVTVLQRHDYNVPVREGRWVPIDPIQFELSVTFDSAITGQFRSESTGQSHAVTNFGEASFTPSFSGIPLTGAGVTTGSRGAATRISNSITTEFGMRQEALAVEQWVSEDASMWSTVSIQLRADLLSLPLAPHAFGDLDDFLRAMRSSDVQFYFADIAATKNFDEFGNPGDPTFTASSASFFGRAVVADAAPVPEPGTLLLVGAGTGAIARRIRNRNRAVTNL